VLVAVLQVLELRHGADLLVATPGRLLELLAKKTVSLARLKLLVRDITLYMLYDMLYDM
jgi:superfamily II DNA/RNA helicase